MESIHLLVGSRMYVAATFGRGKKYMYPEERFLISPLHDMEGDLRYQGNIGEVLRWLFDLRYWVVIWWKVKYSQNSDFDREFPDRDIEHSNEE